MRLAEPKRLGQIRYALARTSQQRSVLWALWRARGQAAREDTERRIARVRDAGAKIRQAGPQLPTLGTPLFGLAKVERWVPPRSSWP
jgi:hypothetical protein